MQAQVIIQNNFINNVECKEKQCQQFKNCQFWLQLKNSKTFENLAAFKASSSTLAPDTAHILSGNRQVRPKMITRVVTWLEKLCKECFIFSTLTLEVAARILVQYLSIVDEPVCNLQLLGAACLFLSSKMSEQTIVAAQSYAECSCNIFTKEELMTKQSQIYKILQANTNFLCLNDIYQQISSLEIKKYISDEQENKIKQYISYCIKDTEFLSYNTFNLMFCIIYYCVYIQQQVDGIQFVRNKMRDGWVLNKK